jgi:SAM-dependent methyltransferase
MTIDRHALYEAAVQSVDFELDFMSRTYSRRNHREARSFREDFCATAAMATAFAARSPDNIAYGVDIDANTLAWARRRRLAHAGETATRVHLTRADVRRTPRRRVDIACALNFSWWVFHQRSELLAYLRAARAGLRPHGILFMDALGGARSEKPLVEKRRVRDRSTPEGRHIPPFTYIWEQVRVDAISRNFVAHIHFEFDNGSRMTRAFTYDWRLWTLIELRELAAEAGFTDFEVWSEGWDKNGRMDGKMQKRTFIDNEDGWTASCALYT